ncbi:MAG: hypothetical protein AAGG65_20260 [Pseudomonadota bacterium]
MGPRREHLNRQLPRAPMACALAMAALTATAGTASAEGFSMTGQYQGMYAYDSTTAALSKQRSHE